MDLPPDFAATQKLYRSSIEQRVQEAVDGLLREGRKPSFYQVAHRANVARSTLYRNATLRACVSEARTRHSDELAATAKPPGCAGDPWQIERLRAELDALQYECDRLEGQLALQRAMTEYPATIYGVCRCEAAA